MSLESALGKLVALGTSNSEPKVVIRIPASHVDHALDDIPLDDEQPGYYRFWATSMYLEFDRVLHKTYFPAIMSIAEFNYGDDSTEIKSVVTPMDAVQDITKSDAGNIVMRNQALTPLIPFNGGSVNVGIALKSMEADDTLKAFASAMGELSKVVTWGPLSTAMNALDPINSAISGLLSLNRDRYIAGFGETFSVSNNPLTPGYIACIDAPVGTVDSENLWVKNSTLYHGRFGADDAEPYTRHDYLLIQVETVRWRDDWRHIGKINDLFDEAMELIGQAAEGSSDANTADNKIKAAILEAYTSVDMTREQRVLIALQLGNEYRKNKGTYEEAIRVIQGDNGQSQQLFLVDLAERAFYLDRSKDTEPIRAPIPHKSELPTLRSLLRV